MAFLQEYALFSRKPRLGFSGKFRGLFKGCFPSKCRKAPEKSTRLYAIHSWCDSFTEVTPTGRTSTRTIDDQGRTVHVQPSCCEAPWSYTYDSYGRLETITQGEDGSSDARVTRR
jgi:hypothetical protein